MKKHPPKRVLKVPEAATASRRQSSALPGGRETEAAAAAVIPAAVDIEPVGIEAADENAATVRVLIAAANPAVREKSFAGCQEVDRQGHQDGPSPGNFH